VQIPVASDPKAARYVPPVSCARPWSACVHEVLFLHNVDEFRELGGGVVLMEHDPLCNGHDGLLSLVQGRQLGLNGVVGVRHECDDFRFTMQMVYLVFSDL
jgi:hypothetical protein